MRSLFLALALLLAGCLSEPTAPAGPGAATPTPASPTPPAQADAWHLGGAWTPEYTQADIDAWCEVARDHDNECIVMESFPPQYVLRFGSEAECLDARAKVLALDHITARECMRAQPPADDPEAPVSSNGTWSLRGTFTDGFTEEDIAAVCEAGTGERTCAMMKSYPPQYAFRFDTREACEEARAKIAAVPHARVEACVHGAQP